MTQITTLTSQALITASAAIILTLTLEQAETLVLQPTPEKLPVGHLPGRTLGGQDPATPLATPKAITREPMDS